LARLRRVREAAGLSAPQVIALSATVDDPEGIRMAYAPSGVFLQAGGGRTIERVSVPGIGGAIEDQLPTYVERLEHPEKVLVFSNSRKRVDTLALRLRRDLEPFGYVVCAHHGSLARKIREDAEASARKERKFVLVSSSTLEVGVDIGDIDLVALDGPPPDIMSLLQRIGRGNRRTGCARVMACARSMTEALVQTSMLKAAEEGYLGRRESGPQLAVARQQIASFIFQRLTGQRTVTQLRAFCSHVRSELNAEELIDHMTSARELLPTSSALRLGDFWQEQAASGAIHSNIESNTGQSVSDDFTGEEIATGVRFKEGPGMRIGGRMLQVRDWDEFRVSVRQVSKTDLADARWNYVVGPRLKGAGQADAVSGFLRIATGHWPVVRASGRYVVFHFGGGRRRAVLELIQKLHPGLAFTRADEWAIYFERRPEKPEWSDSVDVARVARLASSSVTALERTLARPRANSKLPASFREREIHDWLNIDGEVVAFRSSCWADPPDSDVAEALESLAKDLLR
jgi:ATP-dependent Lhr-like helicase